MTDRDFLHLKQNHIMTRQSPRYKICYSVPQKIDNELVENYSYFYIKLQFIVICTFSKLNIPIEGSIK